ncbi:MAG: Short-chain dehydrogenase/reductase SDR, partial [uncultured Solirubrobacterales bacterium]
GQLIRSPPRRRDRSLQRHRARAGQAVRTGRLRPRHRRRGRRRLGRHHRAREPGRERRGRAGRSRDRRRSRRALPADRRDRSSRRRRRPQRRGRPRRAVRRDPARGRAEDRRPQRALDRPPGQAHGARHGRSRSGSHPDHLVDSRDHARLVPGGLQRLEVLRPVVRPGAAQRAQGHRRHRHLAHAGTDGDRVLRARRHAGHEDRCGEEGRPRRCGSTGLRGDDGRRGARRGRVGVDQASGSRKPPPPRQRQGGGAPQDGGAGLGEGV